MGFVRTEVAGAGSFAVDAAAPADFAATLLERHAEAARSGAVLKRKYETVVTRVGLRADEAAALGLECAAAAVKQSAVDAARRVLHRLGMPSRYRLDLRHAEALRARGIGAPRVLLHSLRPAGTHEYLATALIPGRTLRELLWLGERALPGARERGALLEALGRWLHQVHEAGVWHRDLKTENVIRRETPATALANPRPEEFHLLDLTRLRFRAGPLPEAQRLRNLAQLLDLPARLDPEATPAMMAGYARDEADAARWSALVRPAIAARRDRRAARTGHRHVDEEYVGTKGPGDV